MSASVPVQVSEEFLNNWNTANTDPTKPFRAFKLKFENEKIIQLNSLPSGKLLKEDLMHLVTSLLMMKLVIYYLDLVDLKHGYLLLIFLIQYLEIQKC